MPDESKPQDGDIAWDYVAWKVHDDLTVEWTKEKHPIGVWMNGEIVRSMNVMVKADKHD